MQEIKNVCLIASTVVATVVGAGFATGQEIYSFFTIYGKWSFLGLLCVAVLFYAVFCYVLMVCYNFKIDSFDDFLQRTHMGYAQKFISLCVAAFSFCGFCAMASATGTFFVQANFSPYWFGVGLMIVLGSILLCFDIQAIAVVNMILAPLISIGLVWFSACGILFRSVETASIAHYAYNGFEIMRSAILYASYNFLSAVVLLCSMRRYCCSERAVRYACFASATVLVFVALCIWAVLSVYQGKIMLGEIPMLTLIERQGKVHENIYSVILLCSVLSTALGCGYAIVDYIQQHLRVKRYIAVLFVSGGAIPVCMLGFSGIVRTLYAFFGYIGLPFLLLLFFAYIKFNRKTKSKIKKYGK